MRKNAIRTLLAVSLAVALVALAAAGASASDFGVRVLAQRGFGDPANSYSWSMAWFRGKLYVGTARKELCVENLTVDYYLPVAGVYTTHPEPGVYCPNNPDNLQLRAEIWQYTPRTRLWRMVYRSPVVRNPRDRHRFVARDLAYRGMVVYHDAHGRPELYVGAVTPDEFLPELKRSHPPSLLSTTDGIHFQAVHGSAIVRTPFGINRPMGFRSMVIWRGQMFVTLTPGITGDGEVFRVDRPWSRHPTFQQLTPSWLDVFEIQVFHNRLYVGTGNHHNGYGVYWTSSRWPGAKWHMAVNDGAGRGQAVTSVVSMAVYRGQLYVGSAGWYNKGVLPISELIRIRADGEWQVVAGAPRVVRGVRKAPISGLVDGFDNIFAAHFWRMVNYRGGLYVGTNDWSWLVQENQRVPWLQTLLSPEFGFDLWATCDGASWFPVTRDAFGNMDDFGARNLIGSPFGLFIGSANHAQGTTVWLDTAPACSSLIRTAASGRHAPVRVKRRLASAPTELEDLSSARQAPARPATLLTDVQPRGTVLSWIRSAHAVRYRVLRAVYDVNVPFTYQMPPTLPNGWLAEDAVPAPVPPGTPGSVQTNLLVPGTFTPIGTTAKDYFVDRTAPRGVKVEYQVVAENASGAVSPGSNLQVVPDPRPPATIGALLKMPGGATAVASLAGSRGHARNRSGELAMLARLLRRRGLDPDTWQLAYRLQRRLAYAGIAGGA